MDLSNVFVKVTELPTKGKKMTYYRPTRKPNPGREMPISDPPASRPNGGELTRGHNHAMNGTLITIFK
jgi:hypothetical protein